MRLMSVPVANMILRPSLATGSKTFMKHHDAMTLVFPEWQCKKVLRGNIFKNQAREIPETEPFVVLGVAYKYDTFCAGLLQQA